MSNSVFNPKLVDTYNQPMFFGESVNLSRNDIQKHKVFETLTKNQIASYWSPEEIKLTEDKKQFRELSTHEQHIFISNLKYQVLLDSIQGRAPCQTFLEVCSLPELENWIITWSFFETIHSRSYTHIMQNVFPDPSIIFDDIPTNPEIIARANQISNYYDNFKRLLIDYKSDESKQSMTSLQKASRLRELKKAFYLNLVAVNVLEGIRFYVSFACSFAFMEGKKVMEGNSKIIQLIAFDEAFHLASTQHIINLIQKNKDDPELFEISLEVKDEVYSIFKEAVEQEKAWASYLFKDGSILGLNEAILVQYLEHICDQRLSAIGYNPLFGKKSNPIPWMSSWLSKNKKTPFPQESELISYQIGQVNNDDGDLSDISL